MSCFYISYSLICFHITASLSTCEAFFLTSSFHIFHSWHVSHDLYTLKTVCVHEIQSHDISLILLNYTPFGLFDVCLCHHLPELHPPSTFFYLPPTFLWTSSFLLSHSLVSVSIFPPFFPPPSFYPFILVVFPNLLLLRPTCQDHRDQFSTTRQHLSSCCIRHGSERPLSSCLLLPWMVGAVCICVCLCVRVLLNLLKDAT